jgi:hypothetical protein
LDWRPARSALRRQPDTHVFGEFPFLDEKGPQMRAFFMVHSLSRPTFALFRPKIAKSLRPIPGKLPFSGD